jgi:hypothetical protein
LPVGDRYQVRPTTNGVDVAGIVPSLVGVGKGDGLRVAVPTGEFVGDGVGLIVREGVHKGMKSVDVELAVSVGDALWVINGVSDGEDDGGIVGTGEPVRIIVSVEVGVSIESSVFVAVHIWVASGGVGVFGSSVTAHAATSSSAVSRISRDKVCIKFMLHPF